MPLYALRSVYVPFCVCLCWFDLSNPVGISIIISALCLVLFLSDPVVCCVCFVTHEDRSRSASAPMLGTV